MGVWEEGDDSGDMFCWVGFVGGDYDVEVNEVVVDMFSFRLDDVDIFVVNGVFDFVVWFVVREFVKDLVIGWYIKNIGDVFNKFWVGIVIEEDDVVNYGGWIVCM